MINYFPNTKRFLVLHLCKTRIQNQTIGQTATNTPPAGLIWSVAGGQRMNARKRSHKPTRSGRESSDQSLSSLGKWPTVQTFHKSANWNLKNRTWIQKSTLWNHTNVRAKAKTLTDNSKSWEGDAREWEAKLQFWNTKKMNKHLKRKWKLTQYYWTEVIRKPHQISLEKKRECGKEHYKMSEWIDVQRQRGHWRLILSSQVSTLGSKMSFKWFWV